jgi:hypothetical protein
MDPAPVPAADADWYLVRAANDCGRGTYGASGGPVNARAALDAAPTTPCP